MAIAAPPWYISRVIRPFFLLLGSTMISEFWGLIGVGTCLLLIQHVSGYALIPRPRGIGFASRKQHPARFRMSLHLYWLILAIFVLMHLVL